MKTKSELIDKALRTAMKAANGGVVVLQIDGKVFYDSIHLKKETWQERNLRRQAEGVKFEKRSAFNPQKWVSSSRGWTFDTKKENYREIKPESKPLPHTAARALWKAQREAGTNEVWISTRPPDGTPFEIPVDQEPGWHADHVYHIKPESKPLPHAELRALWQKYRDEGKEVVWQIMTPFHSEWTDLSPKRELLWLGTSRYRVKPAIRVKPQVKPKTVKVYFGFFRKETEVQGYASAESEVDLLNQGLNEGFVLVGSIQSREVEIKP